MKIALLGYGKMGKAIEKIALERGHSVVLKIDENTKRYNIKDADVAIEFSTPASAYDNIENALKNSVPVIAGTTGWLDKYSQICDYCKQVDGSFIYASNFSVGVNIFFELNKKLAQMMAKLKDYNVSIEETHHIHKLDAPSGTAITLAQDIIANSDKKQWVQGRANKDEIEIKSLRMGEIAGIHKVNYDSHVDSIQITHSANSREGFALGAVLAAEWILDKKGVFSMKDVLFGQE